MRFVAVGSLKDRGVAARLKIVGTGEETGRLRTEAARLGLIREVDFTERFLKRRKIAA